MDFLLQNEVIPDYRDNEICLFNRDCMEVMKAIPSESIDLIVTDPPYHICSGGKQEKKERSKIYAVECSTDIVEQMQI